MAIVIYSSKHSSSCIHRRCETEPLAGIHQHVIVKRLEFSSGPKSTLGRNVNGCDVSNNFKFEIFLKVSIFNKAKPNLPEVQEFVHILEPASIED